MQTVFSLPGPLFLLGYGIFAAALLALLIALRRRCEAQPPPRLDTRDPYLIAYLRGGQEEVVRVALVTLVHSGHLRADEAQVRYAEPQPGRSPESPLERAVLDGCRRGGASEAFKLLKMPEVLGLCRRYKEALKKKGLLPQGPEYVLRVLLSGVGVGLLVAVATHKLNLAALRGRSNTGLLEVLRWALPALTTYLLLRPRRTNTGDQVLAGLQALLGGQRQRAREVGVGPEGVLLGAVFGVALMSSAGYAQAHALFPRAQTTSSSGCSSGCGSGCGGGGGCGGCGGGGD